MSAHNTKTARERLSELWAMTTDWTHAEADEYDRLAVIVRDQRAARQPVKGSM